MSGSDDGSTVATNETVRETIDEALEWIGFNTKAGREAII